MTDICFAHRLLSVISVSESFDVYSMSTEQNSSSIRINLSRTASCRTRARPCNLQSLSTDLLADQRQQLKASKASNVNPLKFVLQYGMDIFDRRYLRQQFTEMGTYESALLHSLVPRDVFLPCSLLFPVFEPLHCLFSRRDRLNGFGINMEGGFYHGFPFTGLMSFPSKS